MNTVEPHNDATRLLHQGSWLSLYSIAFTNKHGKLKTWECAMRNHSRGAAMMIATLDPSRRLLIVRQFRPPLNRKSVEFPAGLIDDGESAAETAVRELYEETGYHGKVIAVAPPTSNSPGLTGEKISTVMMEVDETAHPINPPVPAMEDDEDIETFKIPLPQLHVFLMEAAARGEVVDSKLMAFALALKYKC